MGSRALGMRSSLGSSRASHGAPSSLPQLAPRLPPLLLALAGLGGVSPEIDGQGHSVDRASGG